MGNDYFLPRAYHMFEHVLSTILQSCTKCNSMIYVFPTFLDALPILRKLTITNQSGLIETFLKDFVAGDFLLDDRLVFVTVARAVRVVLLDAISLSAIVDANCPFF